jgi:hypothetical protein
LWILDWAPAAEEALTHTENLIDPQPKYVRRMRMKSPEELEIEEMEESDTEEY